MHHTRSILTSPSVTHFIANPFPLLVNVYTVLLNWFVIFDKLASFAGGALERCRITGPDKATPLGVCQANQQNYDCPIIDLSLSQVTSFGKRLTDFVYGLSLLLTRLSITRLK